MPKRRLVPGDVRGPFTVVKDTGRSEMQGDQVAGVYIVRCRCGRRSRRNGVVLSVSHCQKQAGCKWCKFSGVTLAEANEERNGRIAWMVRHGVSDIVTIGAIFGLTKQRVQQIEKAVYGRHSGV